MYILIYEKRKEMKKNSIILLFTLLLSACVDENQKNESLTKEEVVISLEALDKGEGFYDNEDYTNALIHFKKSANLNNSIALFYLGEMYDKGYGVTENYEEAFKYYKKSADLGYVDGIKKSADLGNEDAIYDLASLYDDMGNYEKAFPLFKKASESEDKIVKRKGL
jgi:TPR repeat protein